jgi:hypothetical protein
MNKNPKKPPNEVLKRRKTLIKFRPYKYRA